MLWILIIEVAIAVILLAFVTPVPGAFLFNTMKYQFAVAFVLVPVAQLAKLLLNISNGYVVTMNGLKLTRWHFDKNPCLFMFGIFLELSVWIGIGFSVFRFMTRE